MADFTDSKDKIFIHSSIGDVVGVMPNDLSLTIEQTYENPFKLTSNPTLQGVAQMFGQTLNWNTSTYYVWMGGSSINLQFTMDFVVDSNSEIDVKGPIRMLMQMGVPRGDGLMGNMRPPFDRGDLPSIKIGNLIYVPSCIITSVNPVFSRPLLSDGSPARVPVTLAIQGGKVLIREDITTSFFPSV